MFKKVDSCMGSIKEIIFNEKHYSKTKRTIAIGYIALLAYFQGTQNYRLGGTLAAIGIISGLVYVGSKMYFYNEKGNVKDRIFLTLFLGLLLWGVYIRYIM